MLTQIMMIEKDVWDLISKGPREPIAQRIIIEGISDQIAVNVMDLEDPKEMWDRLKTICSEVGQGVVYSILQEPLHYPAAKKTKGLDKPVVEIVAEVRYLFKRLKATMSEGRDPFDTIAIVIALDTLHNNFDTTTASKLETGDKSIDEIFTIIQLKEAKFKSKRVTKNIDDAAMAFRAPPPKRKATYATTVTRKDTLDETATFLIIEEKRTSLADSSLSSKRITTHRLELCHNRNIEQIMQWKSGMKMKNQSLFNPVAPQQLFKPLLFKKYQRKKHGIWIQESHDIFVMTVAWSQIFGQCQSILLQLERKSFAQKKLAPFLFF